MLLSVAHSTVYHYSQPVRLGTHRLMVRPLEGHDVQIRTSWLEIEPAHEIRWIRDVFGNSLALVDFRAAADYIRIASRVTVEQFNTNPFDFSLEPYAGELPLGYLPDEAPDVAPYCQLQHPADAAALRAWLRPFLDVNGRARTLDLLLTLNKSVPLFFQYARREEPGVQSPGETLHRRSGSCRDFALLLMEAARLLGLGARFVSGYLCQSGDDQSAAALGATHAWAEIYLPGAGWKGFDPTCGILAADHHIRVAATRTPAQAAPVSGTFVGDPSWYRRLEVTVDARVAAGV